MDTRLIYLKKLHPYYLQRIREQAVDAVVVFACMLGVLLIMVCAAFADYSDDAIADAIYIAEGGAKAKVPYGILSVKVNSKEEARRVCLNTIRNNRKRFAKQNKYTDFIEFLASRYAPIGASNDPKNLNKNWVKNVKRILERSGAPLTPNTRRSTTPLTPNTRRSGAPLTPNTRRSTTPLTPNLSRRF